MMTWLQTALVLAAIALIVYGMWRAWSRPDPAFDLTRQYEKAMGALSGWETDAPDTQPTVRVIPASESPTPPWLMKMTAQGEVVWNPDAQPSPADHVDEETTP